MGFEGVFAVDGTNCVPEGLLCAVGVKVGSGDFSKFSKTESSPGIPARTWKLLETLTL